MLATSNFAEVGRSYKNILRVSLGFRQFNFGIWVYMGLPERGRSEGDSFGNWRDLKISIISAIYTLVPSRLPSGEEEQQINVAISATPARLVRRCQVER